MSHPGTRNEIDADLYLWAKVLTAHMQEVIALKARIKELEDLHAQHIFVTVDNGKEIK
jgi:hypothetical protein